jgi:class 3 adenylate cyclase
MSETGDELKIENKIVVVIDICSSSEIMEDLLRTGNMIIWRNFLINFKKHLAEASEKLNFGLYKFIGDGWILLFDFKYDGTEILRFLTELLEKFEIDFKDSIFRHLENPPEISGLTFGMDYGSLVFIKMMDRDEYVGRAINIASRLQGAIADTDILTGYRVMISNSLFQSMDTKLGNFHPELVKRKLKNIVRGGEFQCYRLSISEIPFKIIKAIYATENNSVDVTRELISQIKGGNIDTFVANQILGGDPDPGAVKTLDVEYFRNGEICRKKVREGARIQLP